MLMSEYADEKVDYCNEAHLLMPSTEVLGIFEGGNPVASAFKPLADNVLIELAEAATETSSGIALAGSLSEDDSPSGKAVAVGAGKVNADGEVRAAAAAPRARRARAPASEETRARAPRAAPPRRHTAARAASRFPPARPAPLADHPGERRARRQRAVRGKFAGSDLSLHRRDEVQGAVPRARASPLVVALGRSRAQILTPERDHIAAHTCLASSPRARPRARTRRRVLGARADLERVSRPHAELLVRWATTSRARRSQRAPTAARAGGEAARSASS